MDVTVPDIGDFKDVPVIEIHVKEGDSVNADDPLITLESDKATMDVPAPAPGSVEKLLIKIGDRISQGSAILTLRPTEAGAMRQPPDLMSQQEPEPPPPRAQREPVVPRDRPAQVAAVDIAGVHASPGVRRLARELGVSLTEMHGRGEKGRITKDDVLALVRGPAPAPAAAATMGIPDIPAQDFAKFGPVETKPLSRIKRISGAHLHRAWLNIPHVTQHDEADITELEPYRKELDAAGKSEGYRVTLLAFLMKASVLALKQYPEVNASLTPEKDALVYKKYIHIGVAVDTPDGLVVPVIRDVDRKGIIELSKELGEVSRRAREGKLGPTEMQGGSFTISSLGGIGGTGFTPVVNAPELAILGVVRARIAPVWNGDSFVPRLMLPLSLSYDHRVIDGALAARFTRRLCHVLEDVRRLVL